MRRTCLIQRLEVPREFYNPFSFGGGLINGGLGDKFIEHLKPIFSFDYMGSSEFEFGALPKAFMKLAQYRQAEILISGKIIVLTEPIFYICSKEHEKEVMQLIEKIAEDEYDLRLKEVTNLRAVLEKKDFMKDLRGWLELDNGFFFFADEEMFKKTCEFFEIDSGLN